MASSTELVAVLKADTAKYVQGFQSATRATSSLGTAILSTSESFRLFDATVKRVGQTMIGIGVGIGGALVLSGKAAADFEGNLRNVNTIAGLTEDKLADLGDELVKLSTRVPQTASELAKGLYDVASSGFAAEEGITVVNAASKAASAGLTQTNTAAKAITGTLNAYGMGAEQAGYVSDILFTTVNKGVITFEELSQGMGVWVSLAATANVSMEQASAALASMTLAGIPAAEANTSLARTIQAFIAPSEKMTEVLEKNNYASGTAAIKALGFKGAIDLMRESAGGSVSAMHELFPEILALNGVLALGTGEGKNYAEIFDTMTDKTAVLGATSEAFSEQSKGMGAQFQLLINAITAFRIELGEELLPLMKPFMTSLRQMFNLFSALPDPIMKVVAVLGLVSTAVLTIGGYFLASSLRAKLYTGVLNIVSNQTGAVFTATRTLFGALSQLITLMLTKTPVIKNFSGAIKGIGTAITTIGRFSPVIAVAGFALMDVMASAKAAKDQARALSDELKSGFDQKTLSGITDTTAAFKEQRAEMQNTVDGYNGLDIAANIFTNAMPFVDSSMKNNVANLKEFNIQSALSREKFTMWQSTASLVAGELGMTKEEVTKLAESLEIDLSSATFLARKTVVEGTGAYDEYGNEIYNVRHNVVSLTDEGKEMTGVIEDNRYMLLSNIDTLAQQDTQLAQLETQMGLTTDATVEFSDAQKNLSNTINQLASPTKAFGDALGFLKEVAATAGQAEVDALQSQLDIEMKAAEAGAEAQKDIYQAMKDANEITSDEYNAAIRGIEDGLDAQKEGFEERGESIKDRAEEIREGVDAITLSLVDYATALENQNKKTREWQQNLITVSARGGQLGFGQDVINYLVSLGEEGVDLVAQMATGSDEETQRMATAIQDNIALGSQQGVIEFESALKIAETAAKSGGYATSEALAEGLQLGLPLVQEIAKKYGTMLQDEFGTVHIQLGGVKVTPMQPTKMPGPGGRGPGGQLVPVEEGGFLPGTLPPIHRDVLVSYRSGGFQPGRASYVPPKRPGVIFAEPSTHGEWYIPHAPAKRGRSTQILGKAADSFGYKLVAKYEDGGFRGRQVMMHRESEATKPRTENAPTVHAQNHYYNFGDVAVSNMEEIENYVDRRRRLTALARGGER